jgi:hypothetical protein
MTTGLLLVNPVTRKSLTVTYSDLMNKIEGWKCRVLDDYKRLLKTSERIALEVGWIIMDPQTGKRCPFSNPPIEQ